MKKRKGAAMVYALIVFVVLFTLGMAILSLTIQNVNMAQIQNEQVQAYYMVLTGVELGTNAVLTKRMVGTEEVEGLLYDYRTDPEKAAMTHHQEFTNEETGQLEGKVDMTIKATTQYGGDLPIGYTPDDVWVEISVVGTSVNARGQERTHAGLIRISTTDPELIVRELMSPLDYSSTP